MNRGPKPPRPAIALLLTAALTIGSMPGTLGVIVVQESSPAFTLDICHPLQGLETPSPSVLPAPIPSGGFHQVLPALGRMADSALTLRPGPALPPDTPPPKALA